MQFKSNKKKSDNSNITQIANETPFISLLKIDKKEKKKKKDNNVDTKSEEVIMKKNKNENDDTNSEEVIMKKNKNENDGTKIEEVIKNKKKYINDYTKSEGFTKNKKNHMDEDTKSEGVIKKKKNKKSQLFSKKSNRKNKDNDTKSEGVSKKKKRKEMDLFSNKDTQKKKKKIKYSEFELNNLEYHEAIIYDKRTFFEMYWSKLKRRHLILFSFFAKNDFNLIYVKIVRFIIEICSNIAMNALFFSDESMHKIYLSYGKYNFIQQIPKILYSSLISLVLDFLICFLIITEKQVFEIICVKQSEQEKNPEQIEKIFKLIKIKFILFYSISFLLLLFFWYFIAAFCAVYKNTQITFLKDFITSFFTGLLYPFAIYFFLALIRKLSLKDSDKKRFRFLYIIGK